jgi:hypothetical protein
MDQTRRSGREQIPRRKYEDYKLYVSMEDEEEFMLTTCKANANIQMEVKDDDGVLEAIVNYILVHYNEKKM